MGDSHLLLLLTWSLPTSGPLWQRGLLVNKVVNSSSGWTNSMRLLVNLWLITISKRVVVNGTPLPCRCPLRLPRHRAPWWQFSRSDRNGCGWAVLVWGLSHVDFHCIISPLTSSRAPRSQLPAPMPRSHFNNFPSSFVSILMESCNVHYNCYINYGCLEWIVQTNDELVRTLSFLGRYAKKNAK